MKQPLIISAIGHAILVVLMIVGLPLFNKSPELTDDVVPVELVERIEEVAKAPPRPQPERQKADDKPPTPPKEEPQPVAVPEPPKQVADVLPDLDKEPQRKPEPKKVEEPKTPSASPQRRPQAPKRFDLNRISALLDKTEKEQPQEKTTPLDMSKVLDKPNRSPLETEQLAASLASIIQAKMQRCWNVPSGARNAEELKVELRIFFLPNGALAKAPEIVDNRRMSDDFYRVAAESARRAVQLCAPYELPADSYDQWREMQLIFDPSKMLGG